MHPAKGPVLMRWFVILNSGLVRSLRSKGEGKINYRWGKETDRLGSVDEKAEAKLALK